MIQKKIIWITGSSGFLGNRLVQHFKSEGHNVVGFSRRGCEDEHDPAHPLTTAFSYFALSCTIT